MILDETLDNYYNNETKRAKYRGLTTGNTGRSKSTVRWIYGIPCILPDATGKYPCKWNAIRTAGGSILPVQPSTISITFCQVLTKVITHATSSHSGVTGMSFIVLYPSYI